MFQFLNRMTNITARTAVHAVEDAVTLLNRNQVIAVPTDTVYGLTCRADNTEAIQNLYKIKKRNISKPIAICVKSVAEMKKWIHLETVPSGLLEALLPGPVTIVGTSATSKLDNSLVLSGKVAARIPNDEFLLNISKRVDFPLALTSANTSDSGSSLSIYEFSDLWPNLARIFDGGTLNNEDSYRAASTVVDLSNPGEFDIIRAGAYRKSIVEILERFCLNEVRK